MLLEFPTQASTRPLIIPVSCALIDTKKKPRIPASRLKLNIYNIYPLKRKLLQNHAIRNPQPESTLLYIIQPTEIRKATAKEELRHHGSVTSFSEMEEGALNDKNSELFPQRKRLINYSLPPRTVLYKRLRSPSTVLFVSDKAKQIKIS
jgi:hypothetical protein